jgi:DNA-directed RNA polymerase subunit RPC12/RpoP
MLTDVKRETDYVRCVECRHEYELPPVGEEMGCPDCGAVSWVSARIPADEPVAKIPK